MRLHLLPLQSYIHEHEYCELYRMIHRTTTEYSLLVCVITLQLGMNRYGHCQQEYISNVHISVNHLLNPATNKCGDKAFLSVPTTHSIKKAVLHVIVIETSATGCFECDKTCSLQAHNFK